MQLASSADISIFSLFGIPVGLLFEKRGTEERRGGRDEVLKTSLVSLSMSKTGNPKYKNSNY